MCFYRPNFKKMVISVKERLRIGFCCALCNRSSHQGLDICNACVKCLTPRVFQQSSTRWSYLCDVCGVEQVDECSFEGADTHIANRPGVEVRYRCHECQACDCIFSRIVAPYRYEFPLDHIIARMKYGQRRAFGRLLGGLLARSVEPSASLPCVVVPVPLHTARQTIRGYNQAGDIARWCAAELDIEYNPHLLTRVFDTGSLAGLSKAARQIRILGAFRAAPQVKGRRIAVVDDVLTTGATAREIARELYDTGALSVELWVLARTSKDR